MKNDDTAARSRSGEETRTLDLGAGETWLSVEQEVNRDLVGSLQILESFTGTAEGKRHHAKKVRDLFARLRASVPNTGTAREIDAEQVRGICAKIDTIDSSWTDDRYTYVRVGELRLLSNALVGYRPSSAPSRGSEQ